jgi:hypothetical protein
MWPVQKIIVIVFDLQEGVSMQFWIYFDAGAGGDGFANLLEHATNVKPWDKDLKVWRLSHYINDAATFYAPPIDHNGCFRTPKNGTSSSAFCQNDNTLHPSYIGRVQNNINTVCTSHDLGLESLNASDCQDILTKNQIKILIENSDPLVTYRACCIKNFKTGSLQPSENWLKWTATLDKSPFDIVIDIAKIKTDWQYVKEFTDRFDIHLSESVYRYWQNLLLFDDLAEQKTVDRWISIIDNDTVLDYQKIG